MAGSTFASRSRSSGVNAESSDSRNASVKAEPSKMDSKVCRTRGMWNTEVTTSRRSSAPAPDFRSCSTFTAFSTVLRDSVSNTTSTDGSRPSCKANRCIASASEAGGGPAPVALIRAISSSLMGILPPERTMRRAAGSSLQAPTAASTRATKIGGGVPSGSSFRPGITTAVIGVARFFATVGSGWKAGEGPLRGRNGAGVVGTGSSLPP
mmetsp:Transcript_79059/g.218813  ORF Transcript_79059/g.218813 Transcript_79059/m.218813 type:complete len:209 (-) Transcript_79059:29-655(-)